MARDGVEDKSFAALTVCMLAPMREDINSGLSPLSLFTQLWSFSNSPKVGEYPSHAGI